MIVKIDEEIRRNRKRRRLSAGIAAVALVSSGICFGLLAAVALIPEQPDRIFVPVERPYEPAVTREGLGV